MKLSVQHSMVTASATDTTLPAVGLADYESRAWRGLLRAHACLSKRLDAELERAHGLPLSSYEVLDRLHAAPGGRMRMSDLAESILLSRSGLTRLVDRLERDGLLERCSCTHDARGAYACLTNAGGERLAGARATQLAAVREHFLGHFTAAELRLFGDLVERVLPGAYGDGACGCE